MSAGTTSESFLGLLPGPPELIPIWIILMSAGAIFCDESFELVHKTVAPGNTIQKEGVYGKGEGQEFGGLLELLKRECDYFKHDG